MAEFVVTKNLTKRFRQVTAVDHLNLKIESGSIFGLFGPDGAGKSTTIRLLATILSPSEGEAKVAGFDVVREADLVRERIGYMAQTFNLYSDLSVEENLHFFAEIFAIPPGEKQKKIEEMLEFSGLNEFRKFRAEYLSGGMKQKLALACTLIHRPEILFLDEPTTGVDPLSRRELWRMLSRLHGQGVTLFLTTPYMDEAERCSYVAFMDKGRIITEGSPTEIKKRFAGCVLVIKAQPLSKAYEVLKTEMKTKQIEIVGETLRIVIEREGSAKFFKEALAAKKILVEDFRVLTGTMESAFVEVIRERGES